MSTALITGASAGLGREFARTLARQHSSLVLVARNEDRLNELADELSGYNIRIEVLPADLTNDDDLARVAHRASHPEGYGRSGDTLEVPGPVTTLINNAGFGLGQDFVGGSLQRELDALNVMVKAVMVLCHAAAPAMRARGEGRIINVSSMTALTAQGTYSAHKAWVRTFSEGLAAELADAKGVSVTAVTPGLIRTEFHERSEVDASQWPRFAFADPQRVVDEALKAADAGRVLVTPTPLYKTAAALAKFAPRALVRRVAGPGLSGRN
ncbi:SDR family NAD(P)-dependent oxidoreductase [Trueperella bialowiezensis]|uniref:Uncharacterized oxidoreductase SAV2478 n=1 Tax=Trueperella bialowiezensis TaxID=312285 RepID=A0A3S4VB07_9ACTO|nr:SDR family NAD(P)-dependent oxidoreductase [Trueperella bialowiezensis]VEI13565.1 Uncharacterized oxidoreductase SAV2478 [Trueperella bialowiezensis]